MKSDSLEQFRKDIEDCSRMYIGKLAMVKKNHGSDEKPQGKRRRRVYHVEKRARVPREETRSDPVLETHSQIYMLGKCDLRTCGADQACEQYNETTHICRCTGNGEPTPPDKKCPRNIVPMEPKPILNVIPPQQFSSTADGFSAPTPTPHIPKLLVSDDIKPKPTEGPVSAIMRPEIYAILGVVGILVFVTTFFMWYHRKRICKVTGKTPPRVLPGEALLPERYITNPQYGTLPTPPQTTDDSDEVQVPLISKNDLTFLEEIGEGCFGKVHKGVLRIDNAEKFVAIKVLKESAGRSAREDFIREVSIMSAFRHPNILTLIGVSNKEDITTSPWMVFEYMKWGDLAGVLRGSRGGGRDGPVIDEPSLLHVALQVAHGMQYLASRRFVHRDLAARNCLVGAQLTVKIADFGMSRDVYTCDYYKMGGERPMPVRWMSPESIVYARFTHESDIWSYGVVLWEIYSRGKQPFYGYNNDEATKRIIHGIILVPPSDCPRFACELMRACWETDPRKRINFDEICKKLEIAAAADGQPAQVRLPRPPATPQDKDGYLVPNLPQTVDYFSPIPDPPADLLDSNSSEDEDEDDDEYT